MLCINHVTLLHIITEKPKKIKYQNAGQNHDMKIENRSFENVAQFKFFGITVTNQNLIHEELKRLFLVMLAAIHS
jgi:hypothetical protein